MDPALTVVKKNKKQEAHILGNWENEKEG